MGGREGGSGGGGSRVEDDWRRGEGDGGGDN